MVFWKETRVISFSSSIFFPKKFIEPKKQSFCIIQVMNLPARFVNQFKTFFNELLPKNGRSWDRDKPVRFSIFFSSVFLRGMHSNWNIYLHTWARKFFFLRVSGFVNRYQWSNGSLWRLFVFRVGIANVYSILISIGNDSMVAQHNIVAENSWLSHVE